MKRFDDTAVLKAIAIAGVVVIHALSSFKTSVFVGYGQQYLGIAVFLDQLSRISVPLFVALSGYGLSQKYAAKKFGLKELLGRQIPKLLPKYIGWSVLFMVLFWLVPAWRSSQPQPSIPFQLLLGRADYHLYFVPMIVQLYLLFPILLWLYRRFPLFTLLAALLIQVIWYWLFSYHDQAPVTSALFLNDREQYIWCFNWLWYFVLGFSLPSMLSFLGKRAVITKLLLISVLLTWVGISLTAVNSIRAGIDPLIVLRFTQYHIMIFASLGIMALFYLVNRMKKYPSPIVWLGKLSYDLYLSHTLWLRMIFYWILFP